MFEMAALPCSVQEWQEITEMPIPTSNEEGWIHKLGAALI